MDGWISLHRKYLDWEWFDDPVMVKIWIYLLLSANHSDGKWHGIDIKRGQLITGLSSLSKKLNLSIKVIRNRLDKLEKTGEIGRQSGNLNTIITICKYDEYQSCSINVGKQAGKGRANEGQTKGKRRATNNNDNKENNIYKFSEFYDSEINEAKKTDVEKELILEYIDFVSFLFGNNKAGVELTTPLKMPKQVGFNQYINLIKNTNYETICQKLYALQNSKIYDNKYKDLYMTLINWTKFKK